eukprot:GCRY01005634.1.p1 GENE.GCRY01005634.1~~GCRY01005634.1.p1  ORF type:complete len:473 (+),score=110.32 GCRY01005634.1:126-1544(+)
MDEKIDLFCAVTETNDREFARHYLSFFHEEVEPAVSAYFENNGQLPSPPPFAFEPSASQSENNTEVPILRPTSSSTSPSSTVPHQPEFARGGSTNASFFSFVLSTIWSSFKGISAFFWSFFQTNYLNSSQLNEQLEQISSTHPNFLSLSLKQGLQEARKQFKLLIVYAHSSSSPDTHAYLRNILTNKDVCDALEKHLCIMQDVRNAPLLFKRLFRFQLYPSLGVCLFDERRPNSAAGEGSVRVLGTIQGPIRPATLIGIIQQLERKAQGIFSAIQSERLSIENARKLRELQDKEFEDSLSADRRKQQNVFPDEPQPQSLLTPSNELDSQLDVRSKTAGEDGGALPHPESGDENEEPPTLRKRIVFVPKSLPEEPSLETEGAVSFGFCFSNGFRTKRNFLADNPVSMLYDYVGQLLHDRPATCGLAEEDTRPAEIPEFVLVRSFPRTVLPSSPTTSVGELNIPSRTLLHVQLE